MWDWFGGTAGNGPPSGGDDDLEPTPLGIILACLGCLCLAWIVIGTPILWVVAILCDCAPQLFTPFGPPRPLGMDLLYWMVILLLVAWGGFHGFAFLAELAQRPKPSIWTPPYRSPRPGGPPPVGPTPGESK
jgi:hypothetical protein